MQQLVSHLGELSKLVGVNRKTLHSLIIMSATTSILGLGVSFFSMVFYDRILPNSAYESLVSLLFGIILILVLDYRLKLKRHEMLESFSNTVERYLNIALFLMTSNVRQNDNTTVPLTVQRDIDQLREMTSSANLSVLVDIPFVAIYLLIIYIFGGFVVLAPLFIILLILIVAKRTESRNKKPIELNTKATKERSNFLADFKISREIVVASGSVGFYKQNWENLGQTIRDTYSATRTNQYHQLTIFGQLGQLLGIVVISIAALTVDLTGVIIACSILAGKTVSPIIQFTNLLARMPSWLVSINNLRPLTEYSIRQTVSEPRKKLVDATGISLTIKTLELNYAIEDRKILDDIHLTIPQGAKVALMGTSGSGKTTFVRALAGFIPEVTSSITYGGYRINELDSESFYSNLSYCPQNPSLIAGTILENILLGREDYDPQRLTDLISDFGFDKYLGDVKDGLLTRIDPTGTRLSVGERRLLCMVRTFLIPARLYLLDEPTSGLDPSSEDRVVKAIQTHTANGETLLVVTHRSKPLELVTQQIILENGAIAKIY
jgi:ATP-binding cassette subfamily C protein LapB